MSANVEKGLPDTGGMKGLLAKPPFPGLMAFFIVFIVQALGHTVMIMMEDIWPGPGYVFESAIAMGLFEESEHPVAGRVRVPRHPAQFGSTPARLTRDAPTLGQHTDEILTELGLADRISGLREAGVVV